MAALSLMLLIEGYATDKGAGLAGIYQTWDAVITRWIRDWKTDQYLELNPPKFYKDVPDCMEELVRNMTLPSLPGQAEMYTTLAL